MTDQHEIAQTPFQWAVCGTGFISHTMIEAIQSSEDSSVALVRRGMRHKTVPPLLPNGRRAS